MLCTREGEEESEKEKKKTGRGEKGTLNLVGGIDYSTRRGKETKQCNRPPQFATFSLSLGGNRENE